LRVGGRILHIFGSATAGCAGPSSNTGCCSRLVKRIVAVQPQHVGSMIIPDAHDEHHAGRERPVHVRHTTVGGEGIGITECSLLGGAEGIGYYVTSNAGNGGLGVGDDNTVLDIETADFIVGELGDHCKFGIRINRHAWTIEVSVSLTE
jgi:hypothetical protein